MTQETTSTWIPPTALQALTEELAGLASIPQPNTETTIRMNELRQILRRAEATRKPDDGLVEPGMRITAQLSGETRATVFLLGDRHLAALDPSVVVDVYSPSSPLGSAIMGSHVGDTVAYTTSAGQRMSVEILAAAPYTG